MQIQRKKTSYILSHLKRVSLSLRTLAKHYGPDLVPFWATYDLNNVTRSHNVDWSYDYGPLFDGTTTSDCPLPCTTTSVNARFVSRKQVLN